MLSGFVVCPSVCAFCVSSVRTIFRYIVGLMLGRRLRRWPSIEPTTANRLVFCPSEISVICGLRKPPQILIIRSSSGWKTLFVDATDALCAVEIASHSHASRAVSRTEQNRTEQNRTEQNRTEQNRTEQNSTVQYRTEQNRTEQNNTEQNRTEQNRKLFICQIKKKKNKWIGSL